MSEIAVIKCGGSIIDNLSARFFENIQQLQQNGIKPIVVHGGGPAIKNMLEKLDVPFAFIDGLRTTSAAAMDVVEMVLSGHVNNAITRKMSAAGIRGAGFSGSDANLLTCVPKDFQTYGYVGDIVDVNAAFLESLLEQHIVPVVAPIAVGKDGDRYNVNADTAAGNIAKAMNADKLIFVTDVPGIMQDGGLVPSATEVQIEELIDKGIIHGGMVPKVKAALACLNDDLQDVMIADANQAISAAGFTGTMINQSEEAVSHDSNFSNL
ncbi:acetylglutamate kinase [Lentibacillus salicampi]|uniref:Acetylglutamate kinase n=1 Tax=Lentibacillus salicampi TaxID=175306 RepID=A0A4Y9AEW6_9BACI|nr:acetylglutamate kinase [Lentibacillus salicampi]TFJ94366.1 acetylglutamate kinase [Lentibacillus salicampi]